MKLEIEKKNAKTRTNDSNISVVICKLAWNNLA